MNNFSLTLAQIIDDFKNNKVDKSTTINHLKSILEDCEDENVRIESIKSLLSIDSKSNDIFKYLENLLISDKNDRIRNEVAKVILINFPDDVYEPIRKI